MLKKLVNKCLNNIWNNSVCVFLYHEVSDCPSEFNKRYNLNVPPSIFKKQIEAIRGLFNVISPTQLLSGDFKTPAALITFDDGMAGYFENAVPILESLKCPSIVFMNMAPVDGEICWASLATYLTTIDHGFKNELKQYFHGSNAQSPHFFLYLTKDIAENYLNKVDREEIYDNVRNFSQGFSTRQHLSESANSKYVYLGNHLYNHYNATILSKKDLQKEYLRNKTELDKYPNSTEMFSYPYGQPDTCYNTETNSILFNLGAQRIFSADAALNFQKDNPFIDRMPILENNYCAEDIKFSCMRYILSSSRHQRNVSKVLTHLKHIWD